MTARTTVTVVGALLLLATSVSPSGAHPPRQGEPLSLGQDQTAPNPPITGHNEMPSFLFMPEQAGGMIERSHQLSASLDQLADQYQGAMKEQILALKRMSDSMGAMAEKMKAELEECHGLLHDDTVSKNQGMQEALHQFNDRLYQMAGPMDDALQSIERMIQHLGDKGSGK
jgi:hypothetical protein